MQNRTDTESFPVSYRRRSALMKNFVCIFLAIFLLTMAALAQAPSIPAPPVAPKRPVNDQYYGVAVTDDYRWLENWDDPAVKQWSAAENVRTREYLDHLPARNAIKERIHQLLA